MTADWMDPREAEHAPLPSSLIGINYQSWRPPGTVIDTLVLHATAWGDYASTLRWFRRPEAGCSAHFLVARSGHIVQLLPTSAKAWHAGTSEIARGDGECWPDVNSFSIGIEIANYGLLIERDGQLGYQAGDVWAPYDRSAYPAPVQAALEYDNGARKIGWWEPYNARQIKAVQAIANRMIKHFPSLRIARIVGHEDIAMPVGRKCDPGPLWPWDKFRAGLNGPVGQADLKRTRAVLGGDDE